MKDLITIFQDWRNRCRQKAEETRMRQVRDSFQVRELNGTLYLMCQGVPYASVDATETADGIVARLSEARGVMGRYLADTDLKDICPDHLGRGYQTANA